MSPISHTQKKKKEYQTKIAEDASPEKNSANRPGSDMEEGEGMQAWPCITSVRGAAKNQRLHTMRGAPQTRLRMRPTRSVKLSKGANALPEMPQYPGRMKLQENSISRVIVYAKNDL